MMAPGRISITALDHALLFDYWSYDRSVLILDLNKSTVLCPARDDESFRYNRMLFPYTQTLAILLFNKISLIIIVSSRRLDWFMFAIHSKQATSIDHVINFNCIVFFSFSLI